MKICAFISLSGGQGKTTSSFFISLLLASQGKKVLAIDCDPQANLTFYLNHEIEANQPSLFEVLTGTVTTEDGIYETIHPNLFLMPSDQSLFKVSEFLSSSGTGAFILKLRLKSVMDIFDYVLIDVQPSRSQICLTAVGAADFIILPAETTTKGVNSVIDTLEFLNEQANLMAFTGKVLGILPFRDRWVGRTQTKESKDNLHAIQEIAPHLLMFPSILESEKYKRGLREGKLLSSLGYPDLEYPLKQIVEALNYD